MRLILLAAALAFVAPGLALAQGGKRDDAVEREIRKLEQAQVDALLRDDTAAMRRNWAEDYVVNNPQVRVGLSPKAVAWAFTASRSANWHPLTWLSHMLDCQLFGLRPGAHHL